MKRLICIIVAVFLLTGCAADQSDMDFALQMRKKLLAGNGFEFLAVICADFTDETYTFSIHCNFGADGGMEFTVVDPQTIAGIAGAVGEDGGEFFLDDKAVAFETIAQGRLTPVTAPWVMIKGLRSGYITAAGKDEENICLQIDDSYAEDAVHLEVWVDARMLPVRAELYWQQQRRITIDVRNFQYL